MIIFGCTCARYDNKDLGERRGLAHGFLVSTDLLQLLVKRDSYLASIQTGSIIPYTYSGWTHIVLSGLCLMKYYET